MAIPLMAISAGAQALGGIVGGIFGGNKAGKARKKQERMINNYETDNNNWFNQEYYKSQLDRTENAHALNKAQDFFKERAGIDAKKGAMMGSTPEAAAASKKAYSSAYSDLVGRIASGASQQRDRIKSAYDQNRDKIFNMRNNLLENQVNQYGNATSNAISSGISGLQGLAGIEGIDKILGLAK